MTPSSEVIAALLGVIVGALVTSATIIAIAAVGKRWAEDDEDEEDNEVEEGEEWKRR